MIRGDSSAHPVLAATASSNEVAAELATSGADAVLAYHSSTYRQRGIPSVAGLLPWDSANQQTLRLLPAVQSGAGATPVIATVCANDAILTLDAMLDAVRDGGARGVLNAPTIGLFTGPVRAALEQAGLGQEREIALIAAAHAVGLQAWCYVFDRHWTQQALLAGADVLVIHLGLTGVDSTHDPTAVASECLDQIARVRPGSLVLLHGGPLTAPTRFTQLLDRLGGPARHANVGFLGASTFEQSSDGRRPGDALRHWRDQLQMWRDSTPPPAAAISTNTAPTPLTSAEQDSM